MAQSLDNVVMHNMTGTLAGMLVIRNRAGKTVVCKRPKKKKGVVATEAQQARRERFTDAVSYAQQAIETPETKAMYEAAAQEGQSAYNVAFADASVSPKVKSINHDGYKGAVGDALLIVATDDFKVASVQVVISGADGNVLEQGPAVLDAKGKNWLYTTIQTNATLTGTKITATATDLPGNTGTLEVTL